MSSIYIIEGPRCVGKSTTVDRILEDAKYTYYSKVFYPKGVYKYLDENQYEYEDCIWEYVEHMVTCNSFGFGKNLIVDRGLLSWVYYNSIPNPQSYLEKWFSMLRKWDIAKIICFTVSEDFHKHLLSKKQWGDFITESKRHLDDNEKFYKLYDLIPNDLRLDFNPEKQEIMEIVNAQEASFDRMSTEQFSKRSICI